MMIVVLKHWFSRLEIRSLNEWKDHVLMSNIPVLVHFHADWSEKSSQLQKQLVPLYNTEKWNIAEVDIDSMSSIVKALEIKTIPCVYLINKGNKIEKYEGDTIKKKLEGIVNQLRIISGEWKEEDLAVYYLNSAFTSFENKNWDDGIERYSEALKIQVCLEKYELTAWIGLAKCHFQRGDYDNAEFFVDRIRNAYSLVLSNNPKLESELKTILKTIGDKKDTSKYYEYKNVIEGINNEIFLDPFNDKLHAKLAITHYDFGFIQEGINKAIQLIESESSLTGLGYKALMEIVADLGPNSQYVKDLQPKLQRIHAKYRNQK